MIEATIETAVLFDLSNSSRLVMSGKDRKDLLHRLSSNDIQSLKPGRGIATLLLERNGRLIDRLLVVDRGHDLLLLGNPGRGDIVREWIEKYTIMEDSQVRDVSGESSAHLLVGPRSAEVLDSAFEGQASPLQRYDNVVVEPGTAQEITIVRVEDYEGPAFLLIGPRNAAAMQDRIGPVAHATMEMLAQLRVKAGLPTWGSELDEKTLPLEARLVDAISFTKGCYVGQEIVARVHHRDRLKRLLCRLEVEGENEPAPNSDILDGEKKIGWITSSAMGLNRCYALGYVETGFDEPGTNVIVAGGGLRRTAKILTLNPKGDPRWPA